jgi:hypothetical protein
MDVFGRGLFQCFITTLPEIYGVPYITCPRFERKTFRVGPLHWSRSGWMLKSCQRAKQCRDFNLYKQGSMRSLMASLKPDPSKINYI